MRRKRRAALLVVLMALAFILGGGLARAGAPVPYVVQPGDTLYSLAKRLGTTVAVLRDLNGIGADGLIRVGQRLILPGAPAAPGQTPAAQAPESGPVFAVVKSTSEAQRATEWLADRGALVGRPPSPAAVSTTPSPAAPGPAIPEPEAAQPAVAEPAGPAQTTPPPIDPRAPVAGAVISCTEEERLLLARLVMAEAGSEPLEGQVGVAAVVVNRMKHRGFPKTVTAIIQEPGQFKAVELGRVQEMVPTAAALAAVDRALGGEDPTSGALFFYNPVKSVAMDFWRTRPVTAVIGGHNFAR